MTARRFNSIEVQRQNIARFSKEEDFDMLRVSYFLLIDAIRQANTQTIGALEEELQKARLEFSAFAERDPLYLEWCSKVLPIIDAEPGILQTHLYRRFPAHERENISYTLYFAEVHGKIRRTRKGRTYALSLMGACKSSSGRLFPD